LGIKTDKALKESSTARVLKHQGYNINRNSKSIENVAFTSTYDNNINNNIHVINDPRIVKQDIETSYMNLDHPRKTSTFNRNNNVTLMILHQNIRGLHNKIEELLNCWSTEFPLNTTYLTTK
jgi:hypothetical protein